MKFPVLILLRGGVFTLAAVFAFAFTQPMEAQNQKWANIPGQQPVNITGQELGTHYYCDSAVEVCTFDTNEAGMRISEEAGLYVPL